MNESHDEHQLFLKHHGIRLKMVTLEDYEPSDNGIGFATFFILKAMVLETIKLKFCIAVDFTKGFYEHQQEVLQWYNKASRHARLKLSTSCNHMELDLVTYMWIKQCPGLDLPDPFNCDC